MRTWTTALLGVLALVALSPVAHADRKLDRDDFKLQVPDGWVEAADIANAALQATTGGGDQVEAKTLCWGHPSKAPIALGIFVRSKQSVGTDIRLELNNFHDGMKKALEKGGASFAKFDLSEGPARLTSSFEAKQGPVRMKGVAIAAVQADGKLLGWSVECIYADGKELDAAVCAKVLGTFQVVRPDKDLRPLNKK